MAHIKEMLASISKKQDELYSRQDVTNNRLNVIDTNLSKISQTVIGDKKYGHKGLVQQVDELNTYVQDDKIRNAKIVGGLAVIGVVWTALMKYVFKV